MYCSTDKGWLGSDGILLDFSRFKPIGSLNISKLEINIVLFVYLQDEDGMSLKVVNNKLQEELFLKMF